MLLRFQKAAVRGNYETGNQAFSKRLRFLTIRVGSGSRTSEATGNRRTSMRATGKPFNIGKEQVYEAYKAVKSNGGAAGVDGQTIEQFEADFKGNLYKIW